MLKSSLCDYSDAYILVSGRRTNWGVGVGKASSALKTLVRICALFENSMFLLDYKNEYFFGKLNEKNRYTILKYIKSLEVFFPLYVIIYDGELLLKV